MQSYSCWLVLLALRGVGSDTDRVGIAWSGFRIPLLTNLVDFLIFPFELPQGCEHRGL